MTENSENLQIKAYERLASGYVASIVDPELHHVLINNLSAALDTDEKIETFARNLGKDSEELKKLLGK